MIVADAKLGVYDGLLTIDWGRGMLWLSNILAGNVLYAVGQPVRIESYGCEDIYAWFSVGGHSFRVDITDWPEMVVLVVGLASKRLS